jgi:hypothetical protein
MPPIHNHARLVEIQKILETLLDEVKKHDDYTLIEKQIGESLQRIKIQINILMGER